MNRLLMIAIMLQPLVALGEAKPNPSDVLVGLTCVTITPDILARITPRQAPSPPAGVLVDHIVPYGPASHHLKAGDVITHICGRGVTTDREAAAAIDGLRAAGTPMPMTVMRLDQSPGKSVWKRRTVSIIPTTYGEFALASVAREHDAIRDLEIISHIDQPPVTARTSVNVHLSQPAGANPVALLRLQFVGTERLLWESATIFVEGEQFVLTPAETPQRDSTDGRVREWHDFPVEGRSERLLDLLQETEGQAQVRFSGKDSQHDHVITVDEIDRIRTVLLVRRMSK